MVMKLAKAPPLVCVLPPMIATDALSKVIAIVPEGKLLPLIATCIPAALETGETTMLAGAVTVKGAVAWVVPTVTIILCRPGVADAGMLIELIKLPPVV